MVAFSGVGGITSAVGFCASLLLLLDADADADEEDGVCGTDDPTELAPDAGAGAAAVTDAAAEDEEEEEADDDGRLETSMTPSSHTAMWAGSTHCSASSLVVGVEGSRGSTVFSRRLKHAAAGAKVARPFRHMSCVCLPKRKSLICSTDTHSSVSRGCMGRLLGSEGTEGT